MERKYKDPSNKVHQINERFTHLLPAGCVEITDDEAAALLAVVLTPEQMIAEVKAEAQRRIYAIVPAWKQANLTARTAELLRIRLDAGSWTAQETAEINAINAIWDKAKALRAYSDTLEASILAGGSPDIMASWPF